MLSELPARRRCAFSVFACLLLLSLNSCKNENQTSATEAQLARPGQTAAGRDTFKHRPDRPLTEYDIEKDETSERESSPSTRSAIDQPQPVYLQNSGGHKQITLSNAFIEKYKNCATITTSCEITGDKVHSASEDGDVHLPVMAADIGLNCVAEIMNVKDESAALNVAKQDENGDPVTITGAWRLWCEHPGAEPHIQFENNAHGGPPTNPDHVFEIHPVSQIGSIKVLDSFKPIVGYTQIKEAKRAFDGYENVPCEITVNPMDQTTTILTPEMGLNYVEFILVLEEEPTFQTIGGRMVRCSVQDLSGNPVVAHRRMVFVKNTVPEIEVQKLHKGASMHVVGIPRIDLAIVSWRARNSVTRPEALTWNLPYEIIIAGKYD